MAHKAPGKAHRSGITLLDLVRMFPDDAAATRWFEATRWAGQRCCPLCGSVRTSAVPRANPMPYHCTDCRKYFSVRTGTVMARSKLGLQKWAFGLYLMSTNLKGVSSMKLHRDLGITQKTAWLMGQKIREAWADQSGPLDGEVEIDETYIGGKRRNMSNAKRKELAGSGRGAVGKTAVLGMKERDGSIKAAPVEHVDQRTVTDAVHAQVRVGSTLYTDEASVYAPTGGLLYEHETVNHSASEYVRGQAHTNGIESFWAMLKRGYNGTYHRMSAKHLARYVREFAGRHNVRDLDTLAQMALLVRGMDGKSLTYEALTR